MSDALTAAIVCIDRGEPTVLATVVEALGSTPREAGARMLVTEHDLAGTIGGGNLEWRAVQAARELLTDGSPDMRELRLPLGPALAQCCGGYVVVRLELLSRTDRPRLLQARAAAQQHLPLVAVFGAGHVGKAVVQALAPLPCRVLLIDPRAEQIPPVLPGNTHATIVADPAMAVAELPTASFVLIMTHSHPLDLEITAVALGRGDLAWVGLIGSATKRTRFERQLRARGLPAERIAALVCPIGLRAIHGKVPPVIAASVAAQLLIAFETQAAAAGAGSSARLEPVA